MNLPKVFEEKMKDLLGSEYEAYTACYDEPRHYGLRVNTAKISVEDFLNIIILQIKDLMNTIQMQIKLV